MANNYSPSINIKRDINSDHLYVPTKNSMEAYETISNNFKTDVHSYNLIGSYGTGKSAFLLAFYKHLNKKEKYFKTVNGQFNGCSEFTFLNIVGSYESLIKSLSDELGIENEEDIVYNKIKSLHSRLKKAKQCLVIVIDEFGKTLEYSAKNNPEKELYFIQKLAEFANDKSRNILFITTLHQNFDAYAIGLDDKDRKEWEKVKGRIKELPFNEPVEQLLDLASNVIAKEFPNLNRLKISSPLLKEIKDTNLFKLRNTLSEELIQNLFPLDPLAASTLLFSLQKYGQNERSLFSYVISLEPHGLKTFLDTNSSSFYSISDVYDYLIYNFSYLLQSRNNPDFFKWRIINSALDRVDNLIVKDIKPSKKLIKTLGLLDLVHSQSASISKGFILKYGKEILGIKSIASILKNLEDKKIIKFQKFRNSYAIFEGTDIDIEQLIASKNKDVGKLTNLSEDLLSYFQVDYEVAKEVSYKIGTPRLFKYEITTNPLEFFNEDSSEIDGIINIVFNKKIKYGSLKTKRTEPIIYCLINAVDNIMSSISELNIIDKILLEEDLDKVAKQEIIAKKVLLEKELEIELKQLIFSKVSNWYYNGKKLNIASRKDLNKNLSSLSIEVYPDTPILKSEHINRSKLSGSIHGAKKNYIKALIANWSKPLLSFEENRFPPERSIYHSLLEDSGIHLNQINYAEFQRPTDKSYKALWDISLQFLNESKKGKRTLSEFVMLLQQRPFKLKDGFIEFWLISFFFIHREEFALYYKGIYMPSFSSEVAELFFKDSQNFQIKAIEVNGIRLKLFNKYRTLIQNTRKEKISNKGFQELAKPYLMFYKQLSNYSKTTNHNISSQTLKLRDTLRNARELEKTFFEDIPKCFGFTIQELEKDSTKLNAFAERLQTAINELRRSESRLLERIKNKLCEFLGLDNSDITGIRKNLQLRYSALPDYLLNNNQKSLINVINSNIESESAWIASFIMNIIGKAPQDFSDADEPIFYEDLNKNLNILNNLIKLSEEHIDSTKEVGYRYELIDTKQNHIKQQFVISLKDEKKIQEIRNDLVKFLNGKDEKLVKGTLIEILKSYEK